MTYEQIIKALECCISSSTALVFFECPMVKNRECNGSNTNINRLVAENALDLINRQKTEIEKLQAEKEAMLDTIHKLGNDYAEALTKEMN